MTIYTIRRNIYLEEVSIMVTGMRSEKHSEGKVVYGNRGGMFGCKKPFAAAIIKLDFPVPFSPTTTTRIGFGEPREPLLPILII